ncbi:MAG: response regulator [Ardenticatenaceae bacterium]|nr:response regulator [Ardenticatenaceae bacterium]
MSDRTILLVDNEPVYLQLAQEYLERHGYRVICAADAVTARQILLETAVDVAIIDIRLLDDTDERDREGLHLAMDTMWGRYVPKIMLTRHESVANAVEALRPLHSGQAPAVNFIMKHEGFPALLTAVEGALHVDVVKLRRFLYLHFNYSELRDLCFDFQVDFDTLAGDNKRDKVRELVAYFERRGRVRHLLINSRRRRPQAPW